MLNLIDFIKHKFDYLQLVYVSGSSKEMHLASSRASFLTQESLCVLFNTQSSQTCHRRRGSRLIVRADSVSNLFLILLCLTTL